MTQTYTKPEAKADSRPQPGFREQLMMTLKILLATGAVLGGLWLLETIVAG